MAFQRVSVGSTAPSVRRLSQISRSTPWAWAAATIWSTFASKVWLRSLYPVIMTRISPRSPPLVALIVWSASVTLPTLQYSGVGRATVSRLHAESMASG